MFHIHNRIELCENAKCAQNLITAPPKIDRMPDDLYLPEGDNTKIKIYYSGDQPMEVTLSKDGKKIDETTHIKYTIFDEYLIIFIKDITKDDAGTYTLTVKNDSGSVSASFTVYITGELKAIFYNAYLLNYLF